uniref:Uncharacterized protein LOC111115846 n=1 Tax=Crassostrea virginica TaxID=6565 RepID=A0A8B8C5P6_CRAVI|nr:uncharacterized protein LOC111115846 [Crassostrea virginica]
MRCTSEEGSSIAGNDTMDPSGQDIIRCDLCERHVPPLHCEICHINLCKVCVGKHILNRPQAHKLVLFKDRESTIFYPRCHNHASNICELQCKTCNIPLCATCVSSGDHDQHEEVRLLEIFTNKKELIERDSRKFRNSIYPRYQEAASNIWDLREEVRRHSHELKTVLNKQREAMITQLDSIVQSMRNEIDERKVQLTVAIDRREEEINNKVNEVKNIIQDLQILQDTDDVCRVTDYTSRNAEFLSLPSQFQVTFPTFTSRTINREEIIQQFGSLSYPPINNLTRPLFDENVITTEEHGSPMINISALSTPNRPLIDAPRVVTDIRTNYQGFNHHIHSVICLNDEKIWTSGTDNSIQLYNLQGDLLKMVETRSGNEPLGIAVTQNGELLYADDRDGSINLVRDTQIQPVITLQGGKPLAMCSTSSGDLLIVIEIKSKKHLKVVRYAGYQEMQSIQYDDHGNPLYSYDHFKYLAENKNLDICVSDSAAGAVVVVNAAGKLRFRYTGPPSTHGGSFHPRGVTTDSLGNIMTAVSMGNHIQIVDQDGRFLRYIDSCGLQRPWGLCVDSKDNLFVTERETGKVKKIQYRSWR